MATSYTSLLGMALPVTGELSGTWGDTVNDYITKYVDAAVAGAQTISGSQTAVTLSTTNGTALSQAGSGSTGSAQYQIINCTGNPASALTVTVPSTSKVYLVLNNTSTSQTVTVKGAATTGVTVAAARAALIAWNGTDFELVATDDASKLNGVLGTANGGTGTSTTFTAGSVVFAGASGVYSQNNSNFFWDNTNNRLGLGVTAPTRLVHLDGGGSTTYLQMTNTASGRTSNDGFQIAQDAANVDLILRENGIMSFYTNNTSKLAITAVGFTQPVAYADTVSALGNTGTATTINLQNANVFTATLTGNCTFTLSNAIATGSSSFTLILTNDGTAGRTVAWAGGSFLFPGGAASLSRTTTANAVDVWVFFTPNGGTTWYGNIAMKNMIA